MISSRFFASLRLCVKALNRNVTGIMSTPALVVVGVVKSAGRLPSLKETKSIIPQKTSLQHFGARLILLVDATADQFAKFKNRRVGDGIKHL